MSDLESEKQKLKNALIEIRSMKLSIDAQLNNKEFIDSWPDSKEKEYLNPTKKWDKIKVAPISKVPYDLLSVATYPYPPEEVPLVYHENGTFHVTNNWRSAKIDFMKGGSSEPEEELGDMNIEKREHAMNKDKKDQNEIWTQKHINNIESQAKLSSNFEKKHGNFFIDCKTRDRTELESILQFTKYAPFISLVNGASNNKPVMNKKATKEVDFDFDEIAEKHGIQILTKRDFQR